MRLFALPIRWCINAPSLNLQTASTMRSLLRRASLAADASQAPAGVTQGSGAATPATPPADGTLLRTIELVRTYPMGGEIIRALDGVTLTLRRGEFVSVIGRSGSGKSTLLNIVG